MSETPVDVTRKKQELNKETFFQANKPMSPKVIKGALLREAIGKLSRALLSFREAKSKS